MIKAIVFDFDGLILDTETAWFESYQIVLKEYGIELPLDIYSQIIGTHDHAFRKFMVEKLGDESMIAVINEKAAVHHKEKMEQANIREGVREFLQEAQQLGLKIGLASSSNRKWVEPYLEKYDLASFFETIKTGDQVEKIKPDPELYIKACEALQVQPNEAIAFEDSVNGSIAAKKAGMFCVIVPNPVTKDLPFKDYDLRIESMQGESIKELINKLTQE